MVAPGKRSQTEDSPERVRADLDALISERIPSVDNFQAIRDRRVALHNRAEQLKMNFSLELDRAYARKKEKCQTRMEAS